ncbi:MAG: APC family permease [Chloroflexi bacterium]|nr:APC family permease [Chloroflexota bacterium]
MSANGQNDVLRQNHLTTWDAVAQSFGFLGPVMVVSFLLGLVAMGAGGAVPLSILIAGIACLAVAYIVSQYATKTAAAGSLYNYVTKSLGPSFGFIGGWIYLMGVGALCISIVGGLGGWLGLLVQEFTGAQLPWVIFSIICAVVLLLAMYFDVKISTRAQLMIAFISVAFVLIFALSIIVRGGAEGLSLAPFSPVSSPEGWGGVFFGLIFGILSFTGFESAASLGEETVNPRKSIPIAIMGCISAAIIFYVIVSYAMAVGFGPKGVAKWGEDPTAMFTLAQTFGGPIILRLMMIAAFIDGLAVALGTYNCATRLAFAMGRDGALPRYLGRSHPVHKTPHTAIISILVLASIVSIIFFALTGPEGWAAQFGFFGGIGGLSIEIIYGIMGISMIVYAPKLFKGEHSAFKHVIVPVVAIVAVLLAIYGSVQPTPDPLMNFIPYITLVLVVIGLALAAYLQASNPGLVSQIGRRLAEDEA